MKFSSATLLIFASALVGVSGQFDNNNTGVGVEEPPMSNTTTGVVVEEPPVVDQPPPVVDQPAPVVNNTEAPGVDNQPSPDNTGVGITGQFGDNSTGFQGPTQPVGVTVPPPVVTPAPITEVPTITPSEEPTITPEPTDLPTPTPSVTNEDVCEDIDDDWEDWYQDITDADHTCSCQPTVEGLADNRIRMSCIGEELYCCAATGICYETDDASEHVIADRLNDGVVDLTIWRSCTNSYQGGVENPILAYRICFEFAYAPMTAVSRQETTEPPLAGCRVAINGNECNSCTPCEQNGPGMVGYDCSNVPGVDQIPPEMFPMGPQTECFSPDFPECTFNGGFVDVDKSVLEPAAAYSSSPLRVFIAFLLAGAAFVWN